MPPCDVVLSDTDVVQPDLMVITNEHLGLLRENGVFGPPDLVVEILSPSSVRRDFSEKLALYASYGVLEYWIVDPTNRAIDLWFGAETSLDTRRSFKGSELVHSHVISEFAIDLTAVFDGLDQLFPQ